jgi:hypothetical protein
MIRCMLLFLLFAFALQNNMAQNYSVSGHIYDAKSGEKLPFVNITLNDQHDLGGSSDINGYFSVQSPDPIHKLHFSYLGYKQKSMLLNATDPHSELKIILIPEALTLNEVQIKLPQNPAEIIIRKTVENIPLNDPEQYPSFYYKNYNKTVYDLYPKKDFRTLFEEKQRLKNINDSSLLKLEDIYQRMHLMLMESYSERFYLYPDHSNERIIASKLSGFSNPKIASLASDYQPFGFYKDMIRILDKDYLNPVSKNSYKRYDCILEDSLFSGQDTVFIISFQPKENKSFDGLKGVLYIHSFQYAIQNVIAEPANRGFIFTRIIQKYEIVADSFWFPVQMNFEIIIENYPTKDIGMKLSGKNFLSDIRINIPLQKKDFRYERVHMDADAGRKDSLFWKKIRPYPLEQKENNTYTVVDSIGSKYHFDALIGSLKKLNQGRLSFRYFDMDVSKFYAYNDTEGIRLGLGLHSNEGLCSFMSAGGYFGYGFKDTRWKYGHDLTFHINRDQETELAFKHSDDVKEPAKAGINYRPSNFNLADFLATNIDYVEQSSVEFRTRAFKYANFLLALKQSHIKPSYDYMYFPDTAQAFYKQHYQFLEFKISVRYAFKEIIIESLDQKITLGSEYPVLYFSYTHGLNKENSGTYDFNKYEFGLYKKMRHRILGTTELRLESGIVDRDIPYSGLFSGRASYNKSIPLVVEKSFHTMRFNEFLSDRYVSLFFSQDIGNLFIRKKYSKPVFTLVHNMGLGDMKSPQNHYFSFSKMDLGYYESGMIIDQLLRLNFLNLGYLGYGIGVFYRYGPYAFESEGKNFSLKISISYSSD